jgi:hypothetical protein
MVGCVVKNCGGSGITTVSNGLVLIGSIVAFNTGDGVNLAGADGQSIVGCVIHGNGGDGIVFASTFADGTVVINNAITANGAYGMDFSAGSFSVNQAYVNANCFGDSGDSTANTSGAINGFAVGADSLVGVSPQYVNAAGLDFTVQNAALKAAGIPGLVGATTWYVDIGPQGECEGSGGGGGATAFAHW